MKTTIIMQMIRIYVWFYQCIGCVKKLKCTIKRKMWMEIEKYVSCQSRPFPSCRDSGNICFSMLAERGKVGFLYCNSAKDI
jgi:hypothetical protein